MKYVRPALVWLFSILIALVMIRQGWPKFFDDGRWTRSFAEWGYPVTLRIAVGAIEVVGSLALLVPRTAAYGAVALSAVMMGAAATLVLDDRTTDAVSPVVYIVVLILIAVARWSTRLTRAESASH